MGGHAGCHRLVVARMIPDKSLEQGVEDLAFRHTGDDLEIERARLGGVAHQQDALAVGAPDHGLALAAGECGDGK